MAEQAKAVKGPGNRAPRGVKPQVKNPMKIFGRLMKFIMKNYGGRYFIVLIGIIASVLANVQGTMFMRNLIDVYIVPMIKEGSTDFGPSGKGYPGGSRILCVGCCVHLRI